MATCRDYFVSILTQKPWAKNDETVGLFSCYHLSPFMRVEISFLLCSILNKHDSKVKDFGLNLVKTQDRLVRLIERHSEK